MQHHNKCKTLQFSIWTVNNNVAYMESIIYRLNHVKQRWWFQWQLLLTKLWDNAQPETYTKKLQDKHTHAKTHVLLQRDTFLSMVRKAILQQCDKTQFLPHTQQHSKMLNHVMLRIKHHWKLYVRRVLIFWTAWSRKVKCVKFPMQCSLHSQMIYQCVKDLLQQYQRTIQVFDIKYYVNNSNYSVNVKGSSWNSITHFLPYKWI